MLFLGGYAVLSNVPPSHVQKVNSRAHDIVTVFVLTLLALQSPKSSMDLRIPVLCTRGMSIKCSCHLQKENFEASSFIRFSAFNSWNDSGFGIAYNDTETQLSTLLKILSCGLAEHKSKFLLASRMWRCEHPWQMELLHSLRDCDDLFQCVVTQPTRGPLGPEL